MRLFNLAFPTSRIPSLLHTLLTYPPMNASVSQALTLSLWRSPAIRNHAFFAQTVPPTPNIKQSIPNSLTSKTNFAHYDYKPSNSKKFFFKSVPLFPLSQNPHLQSKTHIPDLKRTTSRSPLSPLPSPLSTENAPRR